ncbi:Mannosyl-oligosaccharide glucosidase, partial [Dissostichus eleginoides]
HSPQPGVSTGSPSSVSPDSSPNTRLKNPVKSSLLRKSKPIDCRILSITSNQPRCCGSSGMKHGAWQGEGMGEPSAVGGILLPLKYLSASVSSSAHIDSVTFMRAMRGRHCCQAEAKSNVEQDYTSTCNLWQRASEHDTCDLSPPAAGWNCHGRFHPPNYSQ